jgi:hypothetical protein
MTVIIVMTLQFSDEIKCETYIIYMLCEAVYTNTTVLSV